MQRNRAIMGNVCSIFDVLLPVKRIFSLGPIVHDAERAKEDSDSIVAIKGNICSIFDMLLPIKRIFSLGPIVGDAEKAKEDSDSIVDGHLENKCLYDNSDSMPKEDMEKLSVEELQRMLLMQLGREAELLEYIFEVVEKTDRVFGRKDFAEENIPPPTPDVLRKSIDMDNLSREQLVELCWDKLQRKDQIMIELDASRRMIVRKFRNNSYRYMCSPDDELKDYKYKTIGDIPQEITNKLSGREFSDFCSAHVNPRTQYATDVQALTHLDELALKDKIRFHRKNTPRQPRHWSAAKEEFRVIPQLFNVRGKGKGKSGEELDTSDAVLVQIDGLTLRKFDEAEYQFVLHLQLVCHARFALELFRQAGDNRLEGVAYYWGEELEENPHLYKCALMAVNQYNILTKSAKVKLLQLLRVNSIHMNGIIDFMTFTAINLVTGEHGIYEAALTEHRGEHLLGLFRDHSKGKTLAIISVIIGG